MRHLLAFILGLIALSVQSQSIWTDISEHDINGVGERRIIPDQYRCYRLDQDLLLPLLATAPLRFSAAAETQNVILAVPMPDGRLGRFRLTESPVMQPPLQAIFPQIRCYTGYGIDDPYAKIKCDFTEWGFHAMIRSPRHSTVFIDPYLHGNKDYYLTYYKKDYRAQKDWFCQSDGFQTKKEDIPQWNGAEFAGDCKLREYVLALACTGEYAAFHGGTTAGAASAMTTSINRVNGVMENDLGVTMVFVAGNNALIFLNAGTDPYTNDDGVAMLDENQTTVDNAIGNANYDIGHVFSTGGGGIAYSPSVCNNSVKAGGVTGSSSPVGDAFDIDYVAHEIGHQFAESHTFYANNANNCDATTINQSTAYEPGSGSTIMAYAGICSPQNVQNNSDAYYHHASIGQTGSYVTGANLGNTCDSEINTSNGAPTANAGSDYTIPRSTPFILTGVGTDPNGDALTYCWEQRNNTAGSGGAPPAATNTNGPMFRSFTPTADPVRYFPQLSSVLSGANGSTWEVLPSVGRTMTFRLTVRDNANAYGCTKEDDMIVTVSGTAGPFAVTAPNTGVTWAGNSTQTVTWSVNNTNAAPVNCANVKISLSTDGGMTFPTVLAASTPNDGSQSVTLPNIGVSTARIKIECATGNIFYDISNVNFSITVPIELIRFDARLKGKNTVVLDWATASERENEGFEIEMAQGKAAFETVGFVKGSEESNEILPYQYEVPYLPGGAYQFRLKQLDRSGKVNYSPIRNVVVDDGYPVALQPNPVARELEVQINAEAETSAAFTLVNQLGQVVFERPALNLFSGKNSMVFDLSALPNGAYLYLFKTESWQKEGTLLIKR